MARRALGCSALVVAKFLRRSARVRAALVPG
jgi:hypothetical protein